MIATNDISAEVIDRNMRRVFAAFRRRAYRSMKQFAVDEIVLPSGEFVGRRFSMHRQPVMAHWFDAVDSGRFSEFVALGPSQSGKSLSCFVIPICYYLFEIQESVIGAVPDAEIIRDKWEESLLPVIERTRYRDLLPRRGAGSKGGKTAAVQFRNGVTLRWMTAGGSDKSRANYTARVICFTETDGFDEAFTTSNEGTKIAQIEARARAWPQNQRRIFKECTVSRDTKHTWDKYTNGSTSSKLLLPCVHCAAFVAPEREHLVGWDQAANEEAAREGARFHCPACGELWSDADRRRSNAESVLVHDGQTVVDGVVHGDAPPTRTFGFRWSAVNNQFLPQGDFGVEEWRGPRSKQPDLEERKLKQFIWTEPITDDLEAIDLTSETVVKAKRDGLTKGQVPDDAVAVGLGVDCGKRLLHWVALAAMPDETMHVCDYGRAEVPTDDFGEEKALRIGFANLKDSLTPIPFGSAMVDIRYLPEFVIGALSTLDDSRWRYHVGLGDNHFVMRGRRYSHPERFNRKLYQHIGNRYFVRRRDRGKKEWTCFSDACYWKGRVHHGFFKRDQQSEPAGTISVYDSTDPNEHITYGKHITAEREEVTYEPLKGHVRKWVTLSRSNHYLDATYMAMVALEYQLRPPKRRVVEQRRVTVSDG